MESTHEHRGNLASLEKNIKRSVWSMFIPIIAFIVILVSTATHSKSVVAEIVGAAVFLAVICLILQLISLWNITTVLKRRHLFELWCLSLLFGVVPSFIPLFIIWQLSFKRLKSEGYKVRYFGLSIER